EIVVEAIDSGSFRARVTAIAREAGLFAKQQLVTGLIIGVLSSYIYDHTLSRRERVQVQVNAQEVIITQGSDRIIVPREVHEAEQMVAKNPEFVRSVKKMLNSVTMDERVVGFGLAPNIDSPPPEVMLPRDLLATVE